MKGSLLAFAGGIFVVILLALSIAWDVSIWRECREHNSFGFCLRLLGR